jgi:hypothetical protein
MARFDRGYIKLYRSILDGDIPRRGPFTFWIFCRILMMANWKEGSAYFGGEQIRLKPGQLITGLEELRGPDPDDDDPHLNRTRGALKYLVLTSRIEQAVNNRGRLITVINWKSYQGEDRQSTDEPQTDHIQTTDRPQLSKEVQEGKNNTSGSEPKKTKRKKAPAHRLEYSPEFEELWRVYGRRGDKALSNELYQALTLDERPKLIQAIRVYVGKNPDLQYRKHLERFLKSDWRAHLESPANPSDLFQFKDSTKEAG